MPEEPGRELRLGVVAMGERLERRADPDRPPRGVRVSSDGERIGLELHLVAEWGTHLPEMAAAVEQAVRTHLEAMIELRVSDVAVIVDDVVGPG